MLLRTHDPLKLRSNICELFFHSFDSISVSFYILEEILSYYFIPLLYCFHFDFQCVPQVSPYFIHPMFSLASVWLTLSRAATSSHVSLEINYVYFKFLFDFALFPRCINFFWLLCLMPFFQVLAIFKWFYLGLCVHLWNWGPLLASL